MFSGGKKKTDLQAEIDQLTEERDLMMNKAEMLDMERKRLMEENEQYKVHIESLKMMLNEKTQGGTGNSSQNVDQIQNVKEVLDSNLSMCLVEQKFLEEFQNNGNDLMSYLDNFKQIVDSPDNTEKDGMIQIEIDAQEKDDFLDLIAAVEEEISFIFKSLVEVNKKLNLKSRELPPLLLQAFNKQLEESIKEGIKQEIDSTNQRLQKEVEQFQTLVKQREEDIKNLMIQLDKQTLKAKDLEEKSPNSQQQQQQDNESGEEDQEQGESEDAGKQLEERYNMIEKQYKERLEGYELTTQNLHADIDNLSKQVEQLSSEKQQVTKERDQYVNEYKAIYEEYSKAAVILQDNEKKYTAELERLTKEVTNYKQSNQDMEQSRDDYKNKMIQENLKKHNAELDLKKAKENYEESQKDLNDEIEARKQDLKKIDALKKKLLESEKRMTDQKKALKKQQQQIVDLQGELDKNIQEQKIIKEEATLTTKENQSREDTEEEKRIDTENNHEFIEVTTGRSMNFEKIQSLEERLEDATKDLEQMKRDNTILQEEKQALQDQLRIIMDKREKGLIEIQKLNKALQQAKQGLNPDISKGSAPYPSTPSSKSISGNYPSMTISHTVSNTSNGESINTIKTEIFSTCKEMKDCLDILYREVLNIVTDSKILQKLTEPDVKSSNYVEKFVMMEKKVNDLILLTQDIQEVFF